LKTPSKTDSRIIVTGPLAFLFTLVFLVQTARADVVFPLTMPFLPYIPLIILVEVLCFPLVAEKAGTCVPLKKGAVSVAIANVASSAVGLFVPGPYRAGILAWFLSAYLLSVAVEAGVYAATLKCGLRRAAVLSASLNAVSYAVASVLFAAQTAR